MRKFLIRLSAVLVVIGSVGIAPQAVSGNALRPRITMVDLGNLGYPWVQATAMNDAGDIVGAGDIGDGFVHLFRWRDGVMTDLGVRGIFGATWPPTIDERGRVFGYYGDYTGVYGFMWQEGTITALPFIPIRVNKHGQILGSRTDRVLLSDSPVGGNIVDITPPGGGEVNGLLLNDRGQVVITVIRQEPVPASRAILWDRGRFTDQV